MDSVSIVYSLVYVCKVCLCYFLYQFLHDFLGFFILFYFILVNLLGYYSCKVIIKYYAID